MLPLADLAPEAGVLRIYRQVFAVLAREHGAMIGDTDLLDVDEAILSAFADVGSEGLTVEQAVAACRRFDSRVVTRRFELLRDYGAISRVLDRPHERFHRASFAPYVMLLFLRRMAAHGGQGELHQLLAFEGMNIRAPRATSADGQGSVQRLAKVFRLMANQLASLVTASPVEELREHAELLWGNRTLIVQAEEVHAEALRRWPELDRDCATLRTALAAYGDAIDAAAARLIEQAGSTRALGLLPVETWRTFAKTSNAEQLAGALDGLVFDAAAPWFSPQDLAVALESAPQSGPARMAPPRPATDSPAPSSIELQTADDVELRAFAEQVLAGRDQVEVLTLLDEVDDWPAGRHLLARLVAVHNSEDIDAELVWRDGLRIDPSAPVPWASEGIFHRIRADLVREMGAA